MSTAYEPSLTISVLRSLAPTSTLRDVIFSKRETTPSAKLDVPGLKAELGGAVEEKGSGEESTGWMTWVEAEAQERMDQGEEERIR
ncbi:hypothetical protein MMC18_007030 [Xylographa bjoerkii]|nr:hypothetical protein [Xylographa bjoerkii]